MNTSIPVFTHLSTAANPPPFYPTYFVHTLTQKEWERKAFIENRVFIDGVDGQKLFQDPGPGLFAHTVKSEEDPTTGDRKYDDPPPSTDTKPQEAPYSELEAVVLLQKEVIEGLRKELRTAYSQFGLTEEEISSLMQQVSPSSGKYL